MSMRAQIRGARPVRRWAAALALAVALMCVATVASAEPEQQDPGAITSDHDYSTARDAIDRKDWMRATRHFERAAKRYPENADIQNYLGFAYRKWGKLDLAFIHYKQALKLDPRHRGAHEYIGEAYLMAGDLASAERHLAALREICLLPCEQLTDLEHEIAEYRAKSAASGAH
jgi:tetratricopeptide (TPR) repeat protein